MQTPDNNLPVHSQRSDDDEINLMDIMLVIAKYNRFIMAFTAVSIALAFVYGLRLPLMYTSNVLIMPSQERTTQAGMLMGQLSSLGLGVGSGANESGSLGVLIKSQRLAYQVVDRLNLKAQYKVKNLEAARNILANETKVTVNKDGTILIECSDRDPKMAALLANAYVQELDRLQSTIAITNASRTRLYFEKQLKLANENLTKIEYELKQSQKNTDLTPMELQNGSMASLIMSLRMQINSIEMELTSLKTYATEQNPQYRNKFMLLASLRGQLQKLENVSYEQEKNVNGIKKLSKKTSSEYLNNMRELKYQQVLVETLKKQYDVAKMDEAKDSNLIQVLNDPIVSEQPSKPRRDVIMIIGTVLGLIISIILAFIMNAFNTAKQIPKSAERLSLLLRYLKGGK